MGGFTAAAGTFHHCLREVHCSSLNLLWFVSVNSQVSELTVVHHVRLKSLVTLEIIQ